MITPGCAFTFDGMKQTLHAIDGSIKLKKTAVLTKVSCPILIQPKGLTFRRITGLPKGF